MFYVPAAVAYFDVDCCEEEAAYVVVLLSGCGLACFKAYADGAEAAADVVSSYDW